MDNAPSLRDELPSTSSAIVADNPRKHVVVLKTRVEGPFGPEQTIYLCGTSHVSKKSGEDVREIIQAVKPQVVMLELCPERINMLKPMQRVEGDTSLYKSLQVWRQGELPLLTVLYSWMMASVADKCEVDPGEEFRIALREADSIGSRVSLGDRLVSITIQRTWAALTKWQKVKLVIDLVLAGIFGSKEDAAKLEDYLREDSDAFTCLLKEFAKDYPGLIRPLLQERDEYMVYSLRLLASQASKIVAVVGAGHLKGIQEKWDSDIDIEDITQVPAPEPKSGSKGWIVAVLVSSTAVASIVFAVRWRRLT